LTSTEKFLVHVIPPFNFELSSQIFSNGDLEIRRFENGRFWQVLRIDGKLALASVMSAGTVDKPRLQVDLEAICELTEDDKKSAVKTIAYLFNLDFDLKGFCSDIEKDQTMSSVAKRLWGLRSPTTQFAFEALVDSIVEQQISLKVANAFERRIVKKWGDTLTLGDKTYYAYPTPKELAGATQQELRAVGLSQRKAEYVRNAASLISEGKLDLEALKRREEASEIIEELDKVKGIGIWTAELTMLRGMQRLEALPADDLGLRRTISHFYCGGKQITSADARKIAENWGTWKGLAAYYLIVAEIVGINPDTLI
jgi:DNA-3-methyladenine glycosylase II